jgi:hypothetical protein
MENKIKFTNNCYHICYFCLQYKSTRKGDLEKHLSKNKKCTLTYTPVDMMDFEKAAQLSLNNRYFFLFDHSKLLFNDYIYIVNNFRDKINYIKYEDVINSNTYLKNNIERIKKEERKNIKNEVQEENQDENQEEIQEENPKEVKLFKCTFCEKEYTSKQNLLIHLKNKKMCENTQLLNKMLEQSQLKNVSEALTNSKQLQEAVINNFNQNNTNCNVQNNTFNNSPMIKLEVTDFGRDVYTYSHIPKSYIKEDDFYLYPNFLNKILENEQNQNIYFMNHDENTKSENKKALIYADETLYKINEDKAIYMILEKLSTTMKYFINKSYKNDEEKEKDKAKLDEIHRYYRVVNGHFKHDTIFKDYDLEDKQFYNLTHKRRSRDVYTAKIKNIINSHGTPISQINNSNLNHSFELYNPDIEDYASTRVRNKDLKKRKDELLF